MNNIELAATIITFCVMAICFAIYYIIKKRNDTISKLENELKAYKEKQESQTKIESELKNIIETSTETQKQLFEVISALKRELQTCKEEIKKLKTPAEFKITDEFRTAEKLIEQKRPLILITGGAGTGKSTFIKSLMNKEDFTVLLAPTGIASLNIGGQTIHSFCKLPPKILTEKDIKTIPDKVDLLRKIKRIVIDEISMVRADLIDALDAFLRINLCSKIPFAGIQVIMIGDLYQLPPVVVERLKKFFTKGHPHKQWTGKFFFSANVLRKKFFEGEIPHITFTEIFRQTEKDFVTVLNNIRVGKDIEKSIKIINQRCLKNESRKIDAVILTAKKKDANNYNYRELYKLSGEFKTFDAMIEDEFPREDYPTLFVLKLKKDARVMFIKNTRSWVNGTTGTITGFEKKEDKEYIYVKIDGQELDTPVQREKWEAYEYKIKKGKLSSNVTGTFSQFPLIPAWALTIHKSQGKTLKNVFIEMEEAFENGQTYVALSRCTHFDGIQLRRPLNVSDIKIDPIVGKFLNCLTNKENE